MQIDAKLCKRIQTHTNAYKRIQTDTINGNININVNLNVNLNVNGNLNVNVNGNGNIYKRSRARHTVFIEN
jgi:hypothetical protein